MNPLSAAQILTAAGLSVIPIKADGTKAAACAWAAYQTRIADQDELKHLFAGMCGIAVIGGAVSGNLEILDIESDAPQNELVNLIDEHLPGLLATLPQVVTPTGGRHILYRCAEIAGNQKLAMSAASKVLIETRGEGGYVVTVTSPPECHPSGKPYTLANGSILKTPTITVEQREILLACCRSFNRLIREEASPAPHKPYSGAKRPGDDYNERGDALEVLLKHGWQVEGRRNGSAYLRRPGKGHGISASWGVVAPGKLYVFSSNAAPFEFERAVDGFGIFARLECGGNFEEATRKLRAMGYGEQPFARLEPRKPERWNDSVTDIEYPAVPPLQVANDSNVDLIYQTMSPTEDNVALVFQDRFQHELRYCQAWGRWLRWNEAKWEADHTLLAFHYCREISRKINQTKGAAAPAKASFARGVEAFARSSRVFATEASQWDSDYWLLNVPSGTVDLRAGEMRPHLKTDHITKCAAVNPADTPRPVFDRFMRDITLEDGGLVEYLQRALGACLSGAVQDNFLLFWYGDQGQNGKNTLSELLAFIIGDYADFIPTETLMATKTQQHLTFLASLRGLRVAVCSEVAEGAHWNEQRIKSLTGDAKISANYMRQDPFSFERTHKHIVLGNHRPMLRIVDPAIKSRLHIVPFRAHFDEETKDPQMGLKLRAEAPAILRWLIDGHMRWLEDGRILKKCSAVQAETDSYFAAQSTNEQWVEECCREGDGAEGQAKELYASFKNWKETRGEGVPSQTRWSEWASNRYSKRKSHGGMVYSGIEIRPRSVLEFRD